MRKTSFEQKYPLLDGYILNDTVKRNLLDDEELYKKYNMNYQLIKAYLHEMNKYYETQEINGFLTELFFKFNGNLFESFIISYLNSSERTKKSPECMKYYKKTLELGEDAVKYIEKGGIIANKNYTEIPKFISSPEILERVKELDNEYLEIRSLKEKYKNEKLSDIYFDLSVKEKAFVNDLIKSGTFNLLDEVFYVFEYSLSTLITILSLVEIDSSILNKEVFSKLGNPIIMMLIYYLIETDLVRATDNIKYLISIDRFDLIKEIVMNNLVSEVAGLTKKELDITDNDVIIAILNKRAVKTKIKDKF